MPWDNNPQMFFRRYPEDSYKIVHGPVAKYNPARHSGNFKLWIEDQGCAGEYLVKLEHGDIYSYKAKEIPQPKMTVERI